MYCNTLEREINLRMFDNPWMLYILISKGEFLIESLKGPHWFECSILPCVIFFDLFRFHLGTRRIYCMDGGDG